MLVSGELVAILKLAENELSNGKPLILTMTGAKMKRKFMKNKKTKKTKSKKTGNTEKMKLLMKRDVVWLGSKHHGKPSGKVIISSCSQLSSFVPHRTQLPPPLSSKQQEHCKRLFPVWVLPR